MRKVSSFSELPGVPAIYALYGGQKQAMHVAYVGQAGSLKTRIIQHLVRRDSSVVTGVSAVNLNPDNITQIRWWEQPDFDEPSILGAAELVAFDVLNPTLRSRGKIEKQAKRLYDDKTFCNKMRIVFEGPAAGYLIVPTLEDAFERILALEANMVDLQQRINEIENKLTQK